MNTPADSGKVTLQASFFLGNRLLASGTIQRVQAVSFPTWNEAFCCKVCGEIWGRLAVDNNGWGFTRSFCPKHDPRSLPDVRLYGFGEPPRAPGGSFLQSYSLEIESLPPAVCLYEFNLWSNLYA